MGTSYFIRKGGKKSSINLSVNYHGVERFTYTLPNSSIKVSEWGDGRLKLGRGKQENSHIQRLLDSLKNDLEGFIIEYQRLHAKPPTKKEIIQFIESGSTITNYFEPKSVFQIIPLISELIEKRSQGLELNKGKRFTQGTIKSYRKTKAKLIEFGKFRRSKVTNLEILQKEFILGFQQFLTNRKGYKLNTVGDNMKTLKSLIESLVNQDKLPFNPFKKFKITITREESDSIALDDEELRDLYELDLTNEPRLENVRDQFLILCWTGLRISDLRSFLSLASPEAGVVSLNNKKTGTVSHIPIFEPVKNILKKYKGKAPRSISEQRMRDYIKEIGMRVSGLSRKVEIKYTQGGVVKRKQHFRYELLTLHVARRTLATRLAEMGIPYHEIMLITGHRTLRTFEIYIKVNKKSVVEGMVERVDMKVKSINNHGKTDIKTNDGNLPE